MSDAELTCNVLDLERAARKAIADERLADYIAGGADDEVTLADNRDAFGAYWLRPRVLSGSDVTLSTTVLGEPVSLPFLIAPTGYHVLLHPDGELATARAAAKAGIPLILAWRAGRDLRDVAATGRGSRWFNVHLSRDTGRLRDRVLEAKACGFEALCLTVDSPVTGNRERDRRSGYTVAARTAAMEAAGFPIDGWSEPRPGATDLPTWDDVQRLAELTDLPVVVKGILDPRDAVQAIEHGASAIYVSNHGGRQLDGSVPAICALPEIASAVEGRAEIYIDGGIRRGSDVLKALALGARAVGIGRPVLWGLAIDGDEGVGRAIQFLADETRRAMLLAGQTNSSAVDPEVVTPTELRHRHPLRSQRWDRGLPDGP